MIRNFATKFLDNFSNFLDNFLDNGKDEFTVRGSTIGPNSHLGKSAPEWMHRQQEKVVQERAAVNAASDLARDRDFQRDIAREAGIAQAREAARLQDNKDFNARTRAIGISVLKAPLALAALPFKFVGSVASTAFTAAKYGAGGVAIATAVAGIIDHVQKPNPENDPTLVRIFEFSQHNLGDFVNRYNLDCKAGVVVDALAGTFDTLLTDAIHAPKPWERSEPSALPEIGADGSVTLPQGSAADEGFDSFLPPPVAAPPMAAPRDMGRSTMDVAPRAGAYGASNGFLSGMFSICNDPEDLPTGVPEQIRPEGELHQEFPHDLRQG